MQMAVHAVKKWQVQFQQTNKLQELKKKTFRQN